MVAFLSLYNHFGYFEIFFTAVPTAAVDVFIVLYALALSFLTFFVLSYYLY